MRHVIRSCTGEREFFNGTGINKLSIKTQRVQIDFCTLFFIRNVFSYAF